MNRKMTFDNGTYCDGKKRLVTIVTRDGFTCTQNPYGSKRIKNAKKF